MVFKPNTNGHKQPGINVIIIGQDIIGETKERKWNLTQEPRTPPKDSPIDCDGGSFTNTEQHSLGMCMYAT